MHRLWIPGPLPGLNEVLRAKGNSFRGGRSEYTSLKKHWMDAVGWQARAQKFPKQDEAHFVYLWREASKRRDPSNFTCGGRKIVEDALQMCGLLANDGWKNVLSIQDYWMVDAKKPGVTVFTMGDRIYAPIEIWQEQDR